MRLREPARFPALLVAIVAAATITGALPAAEPTIRVAGSIHLAAPVTARARMLVDPSRHRGYLLADASHFEVSILDLRRLRVLERVQLVVPPGAIAVDPIRHSLLIADRNGCGLTRLDAVTRSIRRFAVPCSPGSTRIDVVSIDAPRSMVTLVGRRGDGTIVRELSLLEDRLVPRWEVAYPGGCAAVAAARMKYGTTVACGDAAGTRALWIPTWHGSPVPDAVGRAIVRATRTGLSVASPALDPRTGRVAITRRDGTIDVFDAPNERLVATIARGIAGAGPLAFDPRAARLYVARDGVVESAELRAASGGARARVTLPRTATGTRALGVDDRLHRFFVPSGSRLIAIQDDRPALPPPSPHSPPATAPERTMSGARALISPTSSEDVRARAGTALDLHAAPPPVVSAPSRARALSSFGTLPFLVVALRRARVRLRAPPVAG